MKILNLLRMIIVGVLVLTSVPLVITYLGKIERQHEFMVILHVISGILCSFSSGTTICFKY
jgi:hypothetical protein